MTGQAHTIYEDELWRSCSLAVHPDGTIFMARADGVHGVDSIAGQKFVVPYQPQGGGPNGTVIVAGDGYFYVPYITEEVENNTVTTRFRLLRVNSAGVSDDIVIETYRTPCCWDGGIKLWANMITNADQGVIIIWSSNAIDSNVPKQLRMAITSGTTVRQLSIVRRQVNTLMLLHLCCRPRTARSSASREFRRTGTTRWWRSTKAARYAGWCRTKHLQ